MNASAMRRHSLQVDADTFLAHYFKRIDPAVATSFSPAQRQAMVRMFATRWSEKHPVNIRKSLGIGRRRIYVVLLAGREKRPMSRLRREGALNPVASLLFYALLTFFGGVAAMALLYGVKSIFGLDLVYQGGFHDALGKLSDQLGRLFSGE